MAASGKSAGKGSGMPSPGAGKGGGGTVEQLWGGPQGYNAANDVYGSGLNVRQPMPGYYNQFPAAGQNYQPPVYPQQRQQYTPQNYLQNAYSQAAAAFNPFGSSYGFAPNRFTPVTMPYQSFYQPYQQQPQPSTNVYFDLYGGGRSPYNAYAQQENPYNGNAQQGGTGGDLFSQVVNQVGGAQQPQPPRQSRFDRVSEVAPDPIRPDIPETSGNTIDVMGQTIDLSQTPPGPFMSTQDAQTHQANTATDSYAGALRQLGVPDRLLPDYENLSEQARADVLRLANNVRQDEVIRNKNFRMEPLSGQANPTTRFTSPNAWGREANPGSYVKDTWTGNGFLVKGTDGRKFRVASEEEAIRRSRGG